MLSKDREENIKKSFYKFMYENLGSSYYLIYSASQDKELEKRIKNKSPADDYWKWVNLYWMNVGSGIFCIAKIQINCNTIISKDRLKDTLVKMVCDVQEEINVDTIPLLDFSADVENPTATGNVLIPRFRGSRELADEANDTVSVEVLDYDIHVWRESVLP